MGEAATAASARKGEPSRRRSAVPRVIAIDGPAAAGKSTVGRQVAAKLGYPFLDTGAMYRAFTWTTLHRGIDLSDEEALSQLAASVRIDVGPPAPGSIEACTITVDGEDVTGKLRHPEVESAVSLVSRVAGVREALVRAQRELAGRRPVVMAGRDIGTVVLPNADLKVYLDASVEERARRRYEELSALGQDVTTESVLDDLRRRDRIDSRRPLSPLRAAPDAVIVNSNDLTLDQVVQKVLELVEASS
ncbi:MAG: (d)CMP kinase [Chloroflexi bacterium]|nr:(d)CMP kinase [Chloroflexota bacterium]